jgi:hypothetical protein
MIEGKVASHHETQKTEDTTNLNASTKISTVTASLPGPRFLVSFRFNIINYLYHVYAKTEGYSHVLACRKDLFTILLF